MGETPQDMADFVEYVNGPADSDVGQQARRRRPPRPLRSAPPGAGQRGARSTTTISSSSERWPRRSGPRTRRSSSSSATSLYGQPIADPVHITGAASGITTLAGHRKILELAKKHGREVWFDVHIDTDGPGAVRHPARAAELRRRPGQLAGGAKHKVVVFELNAGNHAQRRALANAVALNAIERLGDRVPVVCSANGLQVDGQNDNGWDQGLLFLNPCKVWPQPPYFVTQHVRAPPAAAVRQGRGEKSGRRAGRDGHGAARTARCCKFRWSTSARRPVETPIRVEGFKPAKAVAQVVELAGKLDDVNTAAEPRRVGAANREWRHGLADDGPLHLPGPLVYRAASGIRCCPARLGVRYVG